MGADIHAFIEIDPDDESAPPVCVTSDGYEGRNYLLFGLIAGVRGDGPIYELRDMPDRLSPILAAYMSAWDMDAHSRGYLHREELEHIEQIYRQQAGQSSGLERAIKIMEQLDGDGRKSRFVFFFDN